MVLISSLPRTQPRFTTFLVRIGGSRRMWSASRPDIARRFTFATQPARQTRWAAASYWSTRNRLPPSGSAWLDLTRMLRCSRSNGPKWLHLKGSNTHGVADLGSDPHSAPRPPCCPAGITEWGSNPNSAGQSPQDTAPTRPSIDVSFTTRQLQRSGNIPLFDRLASSSGQLTTPTVRRGKPCH